MSTPKASDTPRSSEKKRVRFKHEAEVREFESLDNPKKPRVQPDAIAALEGEIGAVNIDSGEELGHSNSHRGQPISANTRDLFSSVSGAAENDGDEEEDANTDWDVFQANAEIDYQEPEQLLNEAGVPFEPFNLKEEREAGYFDAVSGGYIQLKRKDDVDDAWADALAATEVDPGWAQSVVDRASAREVKARIKSGGGVGGKGQSSSNVAGNNSNNRDISIQEVKELKGKIVSLLQPGENVLAALRRLGRHRAPGTSRSPKNSNKTTTAAAEASNEAVVVTGKTGVDDEGGVVNNESRKMELQVKQHSLVKRASLTPQAQVEFDQLTEWSSLLMEAGEFMIHSQIREEVLRSLESQDMNGEETADPSMDAAGRYIAGGSPAVEKEDIDMFAAEAEDNALVTKDATEKEREETAPSSQSPPPPPPPPAAAEENAEQQLLLQGFILDQNSGYYYNSSLGAYYDPASSLFGDAASGRWYRLDQSTGQYILV